MQIVMATLAVLFDYPKYWGWAKRIPGMGESGTVIHPDCKLRVRERSELVGGYWTERGWAEYGYKDVYSVYYQVDGHLFNKKETAAQYCVHMGVDASYLDTLQYPADM